MEKVLSQTKLDKVFHYQLQGGAIVYLRKNIEEVTDGDETYWQADELMTTTTLSKAEAEAAFDELWAKALDESKTLTEKLDETLASIDEIALAVAELGAIVGGE